jgi:hypothetical protein
MNGPLELAASLGQWFLPRRRLESQAEGLLLQRFLVGGCRVLFFKSGRSALSALFEALAEEYPGRRVLVPDYICNVVPRAVTRAGLGLLAYRTSDRFEADLGDLQVRLEDASVAALVLASLFGSDNTCPAMLRRVREVRPDLLVVLDDCQNLLLNRAVLPDARTAVVFSFNMKTIAGAMGGGVCLGEDGFDLQHPEAQWLPGFRLECAVAMVFLRQVCRRVWRGIQGRLGRRLYDPPGLEYSEAAGRIHYDMLPQPIAKLSLVRAIIGMRAAARTESMRKRNFEELRSFLQRTGAGEIVPTPCPASAPFVPVRLVKPAFLTRVPWKGPYALEGDPHRTLRPELLCFRNDGLESFSAVVA